MGADADSRDEARGEEDHPTEEEQVEREWHLWLLAAVALGGVVLILFPPSIWPDLGFALVGVAVIGWILKTVLERWM